MTVKQIRNLCEAEPFEPFVIFLSDGRMCSIRHPEFLGFVDGSRMVIVHEVGGASEIVDPQLVTSLRLPGVEESLD